MHTTLLLVLFMAWFPIHGGGSQDECSPWDAECTCKSMGPGVHALPFSCTKYYECTPTTGKLLDCPDDTGFDSFSHQCTKTAFIECQAAFEEAVTKRQQLAAQRGMLEDTAGIEDLDGDPSIKMTQDLLLNLLPAMPFGESSAPLVSAMYSGRLKRSDIEAAPESVIDGLLANIRVDVLQRIKAIMPPALESKVQAASIARGRIAQETTAASPLLSPGFTDAKLNAVPPGGSPADATASPSGGTNNVINQQASYDYTYSPPLTPGVSPGASPRPVSPGVSPPRSPVPVSPTPRPPTPPITPPTPCPGGHCGGGMFPFPMQGFPIFGGFGGGFGGGCGGCCCGGCGGGGGGGFVIPMPMPMPMPSPPVYVPVPTPVPTPVPVPVPTPVPIPTPVCPTPPPYYYSPSPIPYASPIPPPYGSPTPYIRPVIPSPPASPPQLFGSPELPLLSPPMPTTDPQEPTPSPSEVGAMSIDDSPPAASNSPPPHGALASIMSVLNFAKHDTSKPAQCSVINLNQRLVGNLLSSSFHTAASPADTAAACCSACSNQHGCEAWQTITLSHENEIICQLFSNAHVLDIVPSSSSLVYRSGFPYGGTHNPPTTRPTPPEPSTTSRCLGFDQSYGNVVGFVRSVHLAKSSPLVDGTVASCCKACDQAGEPLCSAFRCDATPDNDCGYCTLYTGVSELLKSKDNSSLPATHSLVALRNNYPLAPCPNLLQGRLVDGTELDVHHMYGGDYQEQCCALCKGEETCVAYHVDLRDMSTPTCTLFSSVKGAVDVGNPAVFAAVPQQLPAAVTAASVP